MHAGLDVHGLSTKCMKTECFSIDIFKEVGQSKIIDQQKNFYSLVIGWNYYDPMTFALYVTHYVAEGK